MDAIAPLAADVAVIGLGVIGGSAALRLAARGTVVRGWSASDADNVAARTAGLRVEGGLAEAVRDANLVLLAVPLDALSDVSSAVVAAAPAKATILHAASLQAASAVRIGAAARDRVIGTHPLAGSHRAGFAGASVDLFRGATVYVEARASARQREDAELFWSLAGAARLEHTSAETHDAAMAWLSHLPQIASTALAAALAAAPVVNDDRFRPGPGARDATRLAMSAWETWRPLLERAPGATLDAVRAFESSLAELRRALEAGDTRSLGDQWARARGWREANEPAAAVRTGAP